MLFTIQNEKIQLSVESLGAQMMSLRSADGTEYLWQGDPAWWSGRAPTLFPAIGRLTEKSYYFRGRLFSMDTHGFASASEFVPAVQEPDRLVLELQSSRETRKQYPFDFCLRISYALAGSTVTVSYQVYNLSREVLPFGIGGHPGFNVPLVKGEQFEDYELEFSQSCQPARILFTPQVYLSGRDETFPLEDGRILKLKHSLFDEDAIILRDMSREVALRSRISGRGVRVSCPDMPYLGFWHWPKSDAPYVCIEPWSSLPSRQDIIEEFSCKSDLIHLAPGKIYENAWSISVF